jgi:RNA polymerase sigma-70 factor (ECF subfamily)
VGSSLTPNTKTEPLLALARAGDQDAWSILVKRYETLLLARLELWMPGFLRRIAAPEDLLQNVLLKVSRRLDTFTYRDEGSLLGWLLAIVENEAKNLKRLGESERACIRRDSGALMEALPEHSPTPSQELERVLEQELLLEAMRGLAPEDQDVLTMRHFGGLSWEEIGAAMGCSRETSKQRYDRAIARMGRRMSLGGPARARPAHGEHRRGLGH